VSQGIKEFNNLSKEQKFKKIWKWVGIVLGQEALSQGALLTREDLAYRVFFARYR
jgi:hypothetical protein